jgi:hypothetical protein
MLADPAHDAPQLGSRPATHDDIARTGVAEHSNVVASGSAAVAI